MQLRREMVRNRLVRRLGGVTGLASEANPPADGDVGGRAIWPGGGKGFVGTPAARPSECGGNSLMGLASDVGLRRRRRIDAAAGAASGLAP